ncbi:hypothetical protein GCM10023321_31450 [Pseudonocardia eucalypti]|uniref:TauD/TfdA-like domain-containing protein n=1 Tax=Pseudonocardia eucalypti TaxID=648755 RepID=A0ABP9Q3P7_9PSEU|nr:alpha-ketoglutarate-dependent taurine dioxygenase [Pseudonocardia eucalypti]
MTAAEVVEQSLVEVEAGDEIIWWESEGTAVRAALNEHFGAEIPGGELPESPDPAAMRAQLRAAAPRLTAIMDRVSAAFADGAASVLVPSLGVAGADPEDQRTALYTVAAMLGDVMANHPDESVVWDVRNRALEMANRPKASDSDRAAGYHTDAGYLRVPPKYFLLYAAHAATCGGGISLLRDGRTLKRQLLETEEGREAVAVLSRNVPRWIPSKYGDVSYAEPDGFQYTPVIGEKPMWRWTPGRTRPGSKRWGEARPSDELVARDPDYSADKIIAALETVSKVLKNGTDEIRLPVATDGLLVIDNHLALHGRTAFKDQQRCYLRIRFHEAAN